MVRTFFFLVALIPALAFGKSPAQKPGAQSTTVLVGSPAATTELTTNEPDQRTFTTDAKRRMSVGFSTVIGRDAVVGAEPYVGIAADATWKLGSSPIYLGIDVSFYEEIKYKLRERNYLIRIDPTAIARFSWGHRVHPYVGVSAGTSIDLLGATSSYDTRTAVTSFEIVARQGIDFDLAQKFSLNVEPAVGLMRGDFFLAPRFSAVFAF